MAPGLGLILAFSTGLCYDFDKALPVCGGQPSSSEGSFALRLSKGGLPMSTSEVLTLCLVIIGICDLFLQAKKK